MSDQVFEAPPLTRSTSAAGATWSLDGLTRVAMVLAAAVVLMWAAFVNGGPFFHPDTRSYIRGPDVAVLKLLGPEYASPWATMDVQPGRTPQLAAGHRVRSFNDGEVLAGRSIYYGALAWMGEMTGGFWLTVFVQALAVAYLLDIVLRALGQGGARAYAAAAGVVAAATPAPLFIALLMPDIWAGVGLGAVALLLSSAARLRTADKLALTGLLAFSVLAHTSNLLLLVVILGLAPGLRWITGRPAPRLRTGLLAGAAALAVGLAGGWLFSFAVTHLAKAAPVNPPFLTARLVADGVGARYLDSHCPAAGFEACRYRTQRPADADDYLWSVDPAKAVFATATSQSRRALGAEQVRFALAVIAWDPAGQAAASLRNVAVQLRDSDLMNFNYKASVRTSFDQVVPPSSLAMLQRTAAYRELWPLAPLQAWYGAVRIAALLLVLAWLGLGLRTSAGRPPQEVQLRALAAVVIVGILANAAICGALSSPYGRYQARIDWLLPVTALLTIGWLVRRRLGGPAAER